jgi:hypothetical protein
VPSLRPPSPVSETQTVVVVACSDLNIRGQNRSVAPESRPAKPLRPEAVRGINAHQSDKTPTVIAIETKARRSGIFQRPSESERAQFQARCE